MFLLPTDTCYGLAGTFTEVEYLEIYRLKGRDFSKQLAILVEDFSDMKRYIEISDEQIAFLKAYPYPWSFLGVRSPDFRLPVYMDPLKYGRLSIRVARVCIPNYQLSIINHQSPFPLFLTSANLSGSSESTTFEMAQKIFPHISGYDGGVCDRPPSDIFALGVEENIEYLRRNY